MIVTGLDIGETTGISSIIFNEHTKVINSFDFRVAGIEKVSEYFIYDTAKEIEKQVATLDPELVVLEGYAYGGRGFFNVSQAEITAQVKRFMVDKKIRFVEAHIGSMRANILGNGRASKAEAKQKVLEFCELHGHGIEKRKFKGNHIYDASVPAILGYFFFTEGLTEEYHNIIVESIIGGGRK